MREKVIDTTVFITDKKTKSPRSKRIKLSVTKGQGLKMLWIETKENLMSIPWENVMVLGQAVDDDYNATRVGGRKK